MREKDRLYVVLCGEIVEIVCYLLQPNRWIRKSIRQRRYTPQPRVHDKVGYPGKADEAIKPWKVLTGNGRKTCPSHLHRYICIAYYILNKEPAAVSKQRTETWANPCVFSRNCKNLQCPSMRVGGVADHVHLLTRHSKNVSVADFIGNLKRDSSKWVKEKIKNSPLFIGKSRL